MRIKESIAIGSMYIAETEDGDLYSWHISDEEIVRCRDCKKAADELTLGEACPLYVINYFDDNGFCAWGER